MLTLRLKDATMRPPCGLFALWPSKAMPTPSTILGSFTTTVWVSRRTRSAHTCGSTCRRRKAGEGAAAFRGPYRTSHDPRADRRGAEARTRVEAEYAVAFSLETRNGSS